MLLYKKEWSNSHNFLLGPIVLCTIDANKNLLELLATSLQGP